MTNDEFLMAASQRYISGSDTLSYNSIDAFFRKAASECDDMDALLPLVGSIADGIAKHFDSQATMLRGQSNRFAAPRL